MQLPPFLLDHWLAEHEFATPPIRYNLASSCGPTWTLNEVLALGGITPLKLGDVRLSYAPPEGNRALREQIARFYNVDPDWIITTTGASEAILILCCLAADANASIVLPTPMFPAFSAVARAWGIKTLTYALNRTDGFSQRAESVMPIVNKDTKLALVNTPHNPTGSVMTANELERLAAALADRTIPLIVDEVYHPLYFGTAVRSAANIPNAIVVSDFSKAFSIPGLRLGWIIEKDAARRERLIDLRSYFTISGSPLTESVAVHALQHIGQVISRLDDVAQRNLKCIEQFMHSHRNTFGWIPPAGGTVTFPWRLDGQSTRLMCQRLAKAGVLFAPGDCFSMPDHFRIGFGGCVNGIEDALEIASKEIRAE